MQLAMRSTLLCLLALPAAEAVRATRQEETMMANPIRKVVTMLQGMQKKIAEEGKKEEDLYEKFMCFCKDGGGDLQASISAAETKVPQVSSDLEESENKLTQSKEELKKAQTDRAAAKAAVKEATAIREKEAASYAAEKAEYDANIAAVNKAVGALEKGMGSSFLQSSAAGQLKELVGKASILEADRAELVSFLSGQATGEYAPASGEITGILKTMGDTMSKALADATAAEEGAIKSFEELVAAKSKEIEALTGAVEAKTTQIGELGVAIVTMKEDLEDTQAALAEDKKYLANLEESCKTKAAEWEVRQKTRAEEQVALAETIKILNDDDALELFKKTLPSPSSSFMQVANTMSSRQKRAMAALEHARSLVSKKDRAGLDLLVVALTSRKAASKGTFDKVVKMIDEMVSVLEQEQVDDDNKKEYCEKQLDTTDDKKKELERTVSDEENAIQTAKDTISTLTSEIAALEKGIKELDKSVGEATEQRKEEHAEYKDLMASDSAAKELLGVAKNRLNKFYNPKLYVPPAKRDLSREDQIVEGMGGTVPTPAPSGIAGTGVAVFYQLALRKDAPSPPPETWDAYSKKSEESTGVIAMIDLLIADLDKELTEAETEEKNAQAEYEKLMSDSAEKRTTDSQSLTEKGAAKADMEESLESHKEHKKEAGMELMATLKYIASLHAECDWLLKYFDVRKEARAGEVDSLKKAKAVLSGADFSLLQMLH